MANWLCRRYRRCEYYWTIVLLVILVFSYTYLYNVHIDSKEGQVEDVVWQRSRREIIHVAAVHQGQGSDSNDAIDGRSLRKTIVSSLKKKLSKTIRTSTEPFASEGASLATTDSSPQTEHNDRVEDKEAVTEKDDPIMKMRGQIDKMNKDEVVLNDDKLPSFDLVMIVQVHRRTEYLKMLVESLRNARDISKVLLVVSFDYYDEELFSVVEKIEFCKVVKIFFPKSMQLYPNEFPGNSPNDCPRDISREQAKEQNCANADHPDSYGHYREAPVTAIKHHWWWKINHVFDGMKVTAGYNGYVVFLEEDLYVAPDIIPVTKQLISLREQHCQDCDIIGLGVDNKMDENLEVFSNKVSILGGQHSLAYAMDYKSFDKIKKCSKEFCTYDDYNWDWTLQSLQNSCFNRSIKSIILDAPRAYHIGTCGTHQFNHGDSDCNWNEEVVQVREFISGNKQYYFPSELLIDMIDTPSNHTYQQGYGGWGDPRDHKLCLSFVHDK